MRYLPSVRAAVPALALALAPTLVLALVFALLAGGPALAADGSFRGWIGHNMAPIMFVALVAFLLIGFPVAFALAANGLIFAFISIELGLFQPNFLQALPLRIYGTMNNDVLLAIPFFTFMGLILERSGMAEDLLDTVGQIFGTVRGGIAYAVIFVGALLAATTGVVAASVISMGLISLPIMLRYGYDRRLASGVIAASGTLAQIIPPSIVLIVMADQLGQSVGDMYEGALVPGLLLVLIYAAYVFVISVLRPKAAPGVPAEAQTLLDADGRSRRKSLLAVVLGSAAAAYLLIGSMGVTGRADFVVLTIATAAGIAFAAAVVNKLLGLNLLSRMAEQAVFVMVPPLILVFLVLGTIFIGLATPTEGGAMGAAGAVILALSKRRLNWTLVRQATESTAKLSAFVIFILLGARVFSLTFYGHIWVEELLVSLPGGQTGFLIVVSIIVFFLAFFLDFFELAFIVIPFLAPAAMALGIDLIWFGVILSVNMQTAFMHPPFGFSLFFLRAVAPTERYRDRITGRTIEPVTTGQIYRGAIPFVLMQCAMIALVIFFPQTVMHYKADDVQMDEQQFQRQLESLTPTFQDFNAAPPTGLGN
jgi:TRAP-type mannitol/chloroaromatic compound transport system permease large subunit